MTASIVPFLDDLGRRGHEPLLSRISATARFDIADGEGTEHRLVRIDRGDIRVSTGNGPADCVVGGDRVTFDAILAGRTSLLAALLRGVLAFEGDPELLVLTQRLFRSPATGSGPDGDGDQGRAGRLS